MHRLFIALRPPSAIRDLLLDVDDDVPGARWQDDAQLHVTLRFVGAVERRVAEDVAMALARIAAPVPTVRIAGVGRFEQRGRIDTLWAALTPAEPLAALHRKIDHALIRIGLPPENRAYLPHVTLARLPRSMGRGPAIDRWLVDHAALSSDAFALPHLILYESHLGKHGARYDPIARWSLG